MIGSSAELSLFLVTKTLTLNRLQSLVVALRTCADQAEASSGWFAMQGDGAGAGGVQGEWFPVIVNNDPFSFLLSAAEKVTSASDWLPGLVFGCWAVTWLAVVIAALIRAKPVDAVRRWQRSLAGWLHRQWQ